MEVFQKRRISVDIVGDVANMLKRLHNTNGSLIRRHRDITSIERAAVRYEEGISVRYIVQGEVNVRKRFSVQSVHLYGDTFEFDARNAKLERIRMQRACKERFTGKRTNC